MNDNRKAMRSMLEPLCNKVPASINTASVQAVREWKKHVTKARKVLDSERSSFEQLQTMFNQLSQYK
jgi:hypothetical protein